MSKNVRERGLVFNSVEEMHEFHAKKAKEQQSAIDKATKQAIKDKTGKASPEEKPLSAMKKSELKLLADSLGLEYDEDATNAELRELIADAEDN